MCEDAVAQSLFERQLTSCKQHFTTLHVPSHTGVRYAMMLIADVSALVPASTTAVPLIWGLISSDG